MIFYSWHKEERSGQWSAEHETGEGRDGRNRSKKDKPACQCLFRFHVNFITPYTLFLDFSSSFLIFFFTVLFLSANCRNRKTGKSFSFQAELQKTTGEFFFLFFFCFYSSPSESLRRFRWFHEWLGVSNNFVNRSGDAYDSSNNSGVSN